MNWEAVHGLLQIENLVRQHGNRFKDLHGRVMAELDRLNEQSKAGAKQPEYPARGENFTVGERRPVTEDPHGS